MKSKGFTLLETLIALAIIAIGFLGIYNLLNLSIDVADYSKRKVLLYKKGFEMFLKKKNFDLFKSEEDYLNDKIFFLLKGEPTVIPGVSEMRLFVKYKNIEDNYIFYETE